MASNMGALVVNVDGLSFSYSGGRTVLRNVIMTLERGSRCLLVGANGTGKSTLLRILAGKHLVKGKVESLGRNAFMQTPDGLRYLGTEWANNPIIRTDVEVAKLVTSCGGENQPERVAKLIGILDVDISWHMHQISDGQRRRVQMLLGLLEPFELLLMDEVTTDLDAIVRRDLLEFLREETENGATIVYATHIFDGLGSWPTHLGHLSFGTLQVLKPITAFSSQLEAHRTNPSNYDNSPLLMLVEGWLRADKAKLVGSKNKNEIIKDRIQARNEDRKNGDKWYNYWRR